MGLGFFERLKERAGTIDSLLCVGLDPRVPEGLKPEAARDAIVEQNGKVIAATADLTLVYKPNIAFYETWGPAGLEALSGTLALIPSVVPVILDAKRGDVGATAEAYAQMAFGYFGVDAVTLSPYMGWDSVEPFVRDPAKGAIVLCKTSNTGANDLQVAGVGVAGETLYHKVADLVHSWGPQFGIVVAANDSFALESIRRRIPSIWFLAPGIGAQGGTITDAVHAGIDDEGFGILPVVSRSIGQAKDPKAAMTESVAEFRAARDSALAARTKKAKTREVRAPATDGLTVPGGDLKTRVLRGMIRNGCFKTGSFVLKSGETSPFYVDLRRIMSDPELLRDVGMAYASLLGPGSALSGYHFDRIAGIPVAGLPLAASASLVSGIPMIFPRMQAKDHGTGNRVEGAFEEGEEILLLDDLITTGKSKIEALEILRGARVNVHHLIVLLERGTQGRRDMEAAGITLHAFAHISEFLPLVQDMGIIDSETRKTMEAYLGL